MLMKKFGIILSLFVVASLSTWAQGAKSIRITEVMTNNQKSIVDEFGMHKAWVELSNTSFTTYNVRGMFPQLPCVSMRRSFCPICTKASPMEASP